MRQATIISVTSDRQLEIPPEIQAQLTPGDEYLIWQTENTILLQKVEHPSDFDLLMAKVEALGPDPDQLTMDEITAIVKEVRREIQSNEHHS
jgi:hypothetical protein